MLKNYHYVLLGVGVAVFSGFCGLGIYQYKADQAIMDEKKETAEFFNYDPKDADKLFFKHSSKEPH